MVEKWMPYLFIFFSFIVVQNVSSKEITLGFDGLADLGTNIDGFGVKFTGATVLACGGSLNCIGFPPFSGRNIIYDQPGFGGVITAEFNSAKTGKVSKVKARVTGNTSVQMTAFDEEGFIVGIDFTGGANYVGSGSSIEANKLLTVDTTETSDFIAHVTFRDSGNTFTIDDFTFDAKPVVVLIDPGHGKLKGEDGLRHYQRPATDIYLLHEDDLTLSISNHAVSYLKENDFEVYISRNDENALYDKACGDDEKEPFSFCNNDLKLRNEWTRSLEIESASGSNKNDVIFVSIHTNGGKGRPVYGRSQALYCLDNALSLSNLVLGELEAIFPRNFSLYSGLRNKCKAVLKGPKRKDSIAILTEVLYHTDSEDEELLNNDSERKKAGEAISKAIKNIVQKGE